MDTVYILIPGVKGWQRSLIYPVCSDLFFKLEEPLKLPFIKILLSLKQVKNHLDKIQMTIKKNSVKIITLWSRDICDQALKLPIFTVLKIIKTETEI